MVDLFGKPTDAQAKKCLPIKPKRTRHVLMRTTTMHHYLLKVGHLICATLAAWMYSGGSCAAVFGDFNGDGFSDMAVGVPHSTVDGTRSAGEVVVTYGGTSGILASSQRQVLHQNVSGIAGKAEVGDSFGGALATGDFNGDGFSDLAIGVAGEDLQTANGNVEDTGSVHIVYGSRSGLNHAATQLLNQNSDGMPGVAERLDRFGGALAAGDFNGDGFGDLAIGAGGESAGVTGAVTQDGIVVVVNGSRRGLLPTTALMLFEDSNQVGGSSEHGNRFGS